MSNRLAVVVPWLLACACAATPVVWVSTELTLTAHALLVLWSVVGLMIAMRTTFVVSGRWAGALALAVCYVYLTLCLGITATWLIRWLLDRHISYATVGGIYVVLLCGVVHNAMTKRQRSGYVVMVVFGEHTTNGEGE